MMTDQMMNGLAQQVSGAQAQFAKTTQAKAMLVAMRQGFDKLIGLGDSVTPEDVIGEAGELIGHGASPTQLAGLLAQMPDGGGAIAGWLQQQEAQVQQAEGQIDQAHDAARHQMGVAGLQHIVGHHLNQAAKAAQAPPMAPDQNSLMSRGES